MIGLLIGCGKNNNLNVEIDGRDDYFSDDPEGPGVVSVKIVLEKNEIKLGEDLKVKLYYGTPVKRLADVTIKIEIIYHICIFFNFFVFFAISSKFLIR